jgi:hypothetical protein
MKAINTAMKMAGGFASAPRVLLAWEHGRSYGHVSRLHVVANLVEQGGGIPIWALPPTCLNKALFIEPSHECVDAPVNAAARATAGFGARSFADVLLGHGFGNIIELAATVRGWMKLFERICPRSVVLDCAPAAQLAAHLMNLRTFQITNGFDAPPPDCPDFGVAFDAFAADPLNDARLVTLDQNIRCAARLCAGRDDVSVESFFDHPQTVFDGVAETDPYGPRCMQWKIGPMGAPPHALWMEWPRTQADRKRVLVYMRCAPGATQVLDGLAHRNVETLCVWPQASAEVLSRFRASSVRVAPFAVALDPLLPHADAVVNYGPSSFVCASLLAGKPQLMMPMDVEKHAVSQRVVQHGAGIVWRRGGSELEGCLDRLLHVPALTAKAEAIAAGYAKVDWMERRQAWGRTLTEDCAVGEAGEEGLEHPSAHEGAAA